MLDLDKILQPDNVDKVKIKDQEWTLNYSTRTALLMNKWYADNTKNGEIDAAKVPVENFINLGCYLIREHHFKDFLLDQEINNMTAIVTNLVVEWQKKYANKDDSTVTQKKNL